MRSIYNNNLFSSLINRGTSRVNENTEAPPTSHQRGEGSNAGHHGKKRHQIWKKTTLRPCFGRDDMLMCNSKLNVRKTDDVVQLVGQNMPFDIENGTQQWLPQVLNLRKTVLFSISQKNKKQKLEEPTAVITNELELHSQESHFISAFSVPIRNCSNPSGLASPKTFQLDLYLHVLYSHKKKLANNCPGHISSQNQNESLLFGPLMSHAF